MYSRGPKGEAFGEEEEEIGMTPMTPTGKYFSSSSLNVTVLAVVEFETPIVDTSSAIPLLQATFLPINPRFSSIMFTDKHGKRHWKRVHVKLEEHVNIPVFPGGLSPEAYDVHFQEYLTKLAMERLPVNRPMWELHIIKYPTSTAAGAVIFKLHHALGDGYSLIGALLSCLQNFNDSSKPLSFPEYRQAPKDGRRWNFCVKVPRFFSMLHNTVSDLTSMLLRTSLVIDDVTPIRTAEPGLEYRPITISSVSFSIDQIKHIKLKLNATINDVITGIIFYGSRLYMESERKGSSNARSTALVLLNTRAINGYRGLEDMVKTDTKSPWGNHFALLPIPIPKSKDATNPLEYVLKTKKLIDRKKNSIGVHLNGLLLEMIRKLRGHEAVARIIYKMVVNTSFAVSNVFGPTEKVTMANYPCKSIYFMVANSPQNMFISIMSYVGKITVAVGSQQSSINNQLFISSLEKAFEKILKAADGVH
ncbi:hypothetical protein Sjap_000267 [Stephania japonica]|uniref:Diacylglycerol O-acyltransferase n=1 Tax=Stephania japonica TaxID=461633 RepID=A0AAP0KHR2_9MAGN